MYYRRNKLVGFWGSYFGSVLGGIITVIIFWGTIQDNNEREIREEKRKLFDKLISDTAYISEMQERILSLPESDVLHGNLTDQLRIRALEVKMRLELAEKSKLCIYTEGPMKFLDAMLSQIKEIQKLQTDIFDEDNERNKEIAIIIKNLCKKGFIFEMEQFIIENEK